MIDWRRLKNRSKTLLVVAAPAAALLVMTAAAVAVHEVRGPAAAVTAPQTAAEHARVLATMFDFLR